MTTARPVTTADNGPRAHRLEVGNRAEMPPAEILQALAEIASEATYHVTANGDGTFTHSWEFPVK